ncbi:MAG TPA: DUF6090 family protein [Flavobacteriaceae bacterium]
MIKFFRKIRQQLLNEGKTARYFKYAIGEIALVMIGILLALQVNNWNEMRKYRATEKDYIDRLINEISLDISYFDTIKKQFEYKETRMIRVISAWQSNTLMVEDSLQYISDFKSAGDINPWYVEPVTWTQLIQTGDLKLIRDKELLDALFNYYNSIKRASDNFNQFPMRMNIKAREQWTEPFVDEPYESFNNIIDVDKLPNAMVFEKIWSKRHEYFNDYTAIAFICTNNKIVMKELETLSKEILETLKSYQRQIN